AKDYLVEKNTANLFSETSKAVSDINNYDFIKYALLQGEPSNLAPKLISELEKLEEFSKALKKNDGPKALKSDLLDKTKPLRKAEQEELTKELLDEAIKTNSKLYLDDFENEALIKELGLKKGVKITLQGDKIAHALNRHGVNSNLAKNGQTPLSKEDIINHSDIVKNADIYAITEGKDGGEVLISAKQINGHFAVVESISTKDNELKFKTAFKENGKL
ncbi:hypothetical protein DMB92_09165, partial [Campylobacter sp. MIT 99-7217]